MDNDKVLLNLSNRIRVEVIMLLTGSLLNILVVLSIGFLIGPQINETHNISIKNHELMLRINNLLDQTEQQVKNKVQDK